jgi:CHAD domain-containing protein
MENLRVKSYNLSKELCSICDSVIDSSLSEIKQRKIDDDILIHTLRKRVKFLRTILKLVRNGIGEQFYKKNNFILRDLNRRSALLRNFSALIIICSESIKDDTDELHPLKILLSRLQSDFNAIKGSIDYSSLYHQQEVTLNRFRTNLHKSKLVKLRFASIKNGLERIYSDASGLLTISKKSPNESNLHEWRKSVKDLYHCISVLSPIKAKIYDRYAIELKQLSDLLGELHDYFELQHYVDSTDKADINLELINAHIDRSKSALRKKSFRLGKKLFKEKPGTFSSRFKKYYSSYKKKPKKILPKDSAG